MGKGRSNRAEMANQGAFTNICARIPIGTWAMIDKYARLHAANNRSRALELMLMEWQRWDEMIREGKKESRAAEIANINKELGIE